MVLSRLFRAARPARFTPRAGPTAAPVSPNPPGVPRGVRGFGAHPTDSIRQPAAVRGLPVTGRQLAGIGAAGALTATGIGAFSYLNQQGGAASITRDRFNIPSGHPFAQPGPGDTPGGAGLPVPPDASTQGGFGGLVGGFADNILLLGLILGGGYLALQAVKK